MLRPEQSTYFAMTYYNGSSSTGSKFANATNYTGGGQITTTCTGYTYSMSGVTTDGWSATAYYIAIP